MLLICSDSILSGTADKILSLLGSRASLLVVCLNELVSSVVSDSRRKIGHRRGDSEATKVRECSKAGRVCFQGDMMLSERGRKREGGKLR